MAGVTAVSRRCFPGPMWYFVTAATQLLGEQTPARPGGKHFVLLKPPPALHLTTPSSVMSAGNFLVLVRSWSDRLPDAARKLPLSSFAPPPRPLLVIVFTLFWAPGSAPGRAVSESSPRAPPCSSPSSARRRASPPRRGGSRAPFLGTRGICGCST